LVGMIQMVGAMLSKLLIDCRSRCAIFSARARISFISVRLPKIEQH
jgi:hypothetical protein